jgi:hypothetical protein
VSILFSTLKLRSITFRNRIAYSGESDRRSAVNPTSVPVKATKDFVVARYGSNFNVQLRRNLL